MKDLFMMGGPVFMGVLTLLFVITTAWIIYHFSAAYRSKEGDKLASLRKLGYGKSMGLFALIVGILGQMIGFSGMFSIIEEVSRSGEKIIPHLVFEGIGSTMIVTVYGLLIYLFSLLLWFVASILIEKKFEPQDRV